MTQRILLKRTGGTVESEPYEDAYNPPPVVTTLKGDASPVKPLLNGRYEQVDIFDWKTPELEDRFNKDSQKYTAGDIETLARMTLESQYDYIALLHGTSAMTDNATAFEQEILRQQPAHGKVISFVGGMVPLSMHNTIAPNGKAVESDLLHALDFTVKYITRQSPGIYIVGQDAHTKRRAFLAPETVKKDLVASQRDLNFTLMRR